MPIKGAHSHHEGDRDASAVQRDASQLRYISEYAQSVALMFPHCPDILCPLLLALPFINLPEAELPFYPCSSYCRMNTSPVPAFPSPGSSDWSHLCSKPPSGPGALLYPLVNPSCPKALKHSWGPAFPAVSVFPAQTIHKSLLHTSQVPLCSPGQHNLL